MESLKNSSHELKCPPCVDPCFQRYDDWSREMNEISYYFRANLSILVFPASLKYAKISLFCVCRCEVFCLLELFSLVVLAPFIFCPPLSLPHHPMTPFTPCTPLPWSLPPLTQKCWKQLQPLWSLSSHPTLTPSFGHLCIPHHPQTISNLMILVYPSFTISLLHYSEKNANLSQLFTHKLTSQNRCTFGTIWSTSEPERTWIWETTSVQETLQCWSFIKNGKSGTMPNDLWWWCMEEVGVCWTSTKKAQILFHWLPPSFVWFNSPTECLLEPWNRSFLHLFSKDDKKVINFQSIRQHITETQNNSWKSHWFNITSLNVIKKNILKRRKRPQLGWPKNEPKVLTSLDEWKINDIGVSKRKKWDDQESEEDMKKETVKMMEEERPKEDEQKELKDQ